MSAIAEGRFDAPLQSERGDELGRLSQAIHRMAARLSGFVHGRYAFSVMENGTPVPAWTARAAQDRFVQLLAAAS